MNISINKEFMNCFMNSQNGLLVREILDLILDFNVSI